MYLVSSELYGNKRILGLWPQFDGGREYIFFLIWCRLPKLNNFWHSKNISFVKICCIDIDVSVGPFSCPYKYFQRSELKASQVSKLLILIYEISHLVTNVQIWRVIGSSNKHAPFLLWRFDGRGYFLSQSVESFLYFLLCFSCLSITWHWHLNISLATPFVF